MATFPRFTGAANKDNTDRIVFNDYQTPAYAATLNLTTKETAAHTTVNVATLTGAITINIAVGTATTGPRIGDTMRMFVVSDGTTRTITWGTGVAAVATTFAVTTLKYGIVNLVFNGTVWVANTTITA